MGSGNWRAGQLGNMGKLKTTEPASPNARPYGSRRQPARIENNRRGTVHSPARLFQYRHQFDHHWQHDDKQDNRKDEQAQRQNHFDLSLIHISEPTRLGMISYA